MKLDMSIERRINDEQTIKYAERYKSRYASAC